jgi:hypothetical protein
MEHQKSTENSDTKGMWGCLGSVLAAFIAGFFLLISSNKIIIPEIVIPTKVPPTPISGATGTIQNITVEHNVKQSFQTGMRIHVSFTINNRQKIKCQMAAYFLSGNGTYLLDYNNRFSTVDGKVSIGSYFTPKYMTAQYEDYQLFMPYNELHLGQGQYTLAFYVIIYDTVYKVSIAQSNNIGFSYTSSAP